MHAAPPTLKAAMAHVNSLEHTAIGALAGLTEVSIMQPTVAIKNALQEGRPLPRQIGQLYRGYGVRLVLGRSMLRSIPV